MRKPYIKHENLRKVLENIDYEKENHEDTEKLINELKHSNLIMACEKGAENTSFIVAEDDDNRYAMVFTDMDEFNKAFPDGQTESHFFVFKFYQVFIREGLFDGCLINPESECVLLKKELFSQITDLPEHNYDGNGCLEAGELKALKTSIDNRELEDFIKNPENIGRYDELFEKISDSTLLTLMLSHDDLTDYAEDGVISMFETGPLGYLYLDEIGGEYATVYTSEDKISNIKTSKYKYSQIVNFSQMVNFILNDDMNGIIINPNAEHILLTREVLLEYSHLLEETCNDSRLNTAILHMFLIEEGV